MSDVCSNAGYDCAYFGKLHADFPTPNDPQRPGKYVEDRIPAWDAYTPKDRRHGFNYWYAYGTFDEHKNPHYWDTDGKRHDPREWSPLHESGKVISYLKNEGYVRDPKKPFFIMVGMNPPHSPYRSLDDCMEQDFNLYKDQPLDSLLVRPNADSKMAKAESVRYYFASVTGVDRAFGQILDALKELGLDKNTIVIFTSDNGPHHEGGADPDFFKSYGPFRGIKRDVYEGGIRIPMVAWCPGTIKAGAQSDHISAFWDVMPTLAELTGTVLPEKTDGISFLPTLLSKKDQQAHDYLYWEFHELNGREALRSGKWKLIRQPIVGETILELYDLSNDIHEDTNLAEKYPDKVKELAVLMLSLIHI